MGNSAPLADESTVQVTPRVVQGSAGLATTLAAQHFAALARDEFAFSGIYRGGPARVEFAVRWGALQPAAHTITFLDYGSLRVLASGFRTNLTVGDYLTATVGVFDSAGRLRVSDNETQVRAVLPDWDRLAGPQQLTVTAGLANFSWSITGLFRFQTVIEFVAAGLTTNSPVFTVEHTAPPEPLRFSPRPLGLALAAYETASNFSASHFTLAIERASGMRRSLNETVVFLICGLDASHQPTTTCFRSASEARSARATDRPSSTNEPNSSFVSQALQPTSTSRTARRMAQTAASGFGVDVRFRFEPAFSTFSEKVHAEATALSRLVAALGRPDDPLRVALKPLGGLRALDGQPLPQASADTTSAPSTPAPLGSRYPIEVVSGAFVQRALSSWSALIIIVLVVA